MIFLVEEGDFRLLDIKLYHDSFVLKQVVLQLLKLITKDQGSLKKEFVQQFLKLERQGCSLLHLLSLNDAPGWREFILTIFSPWTISNNLRTEPEVGKKNSIFFNIRKWNRPCFQVHAPTTELEFSARPGMFSHSELLCIHDQTVAFCWTGDGHHLPDGLWPAPGFCSCPCSSSTR